MEILKKEENFGDEKADCLLYTKSFFGGLPLLFDVYADFELASQFAF